MEAVGARYHSHKEYFKSLAPANATEAPDPAKTSLVDPDVETADQSPELPRLSPHREVYAPLIRPPSGWKMGALTCLTRTYEREATRTRRGPSADVEEELMSDETDEEALEEELEEEDEVDVLDMRLAATEEETLWDGVRR